MSYLRSGIFLAPFHNLPENPTLAMERDMELLQHIDKLNYHEAWIGEHHSGGFEIIASPEMFIAAAAERTRHIRLGTGVASWGYWAVGYAGNHHSTIPGGTCHGYPFRRPRCHRDWAGLGLAARMPCCWRAEGRRWW